MTMKTNSPSSSRGILRKLAMYALAAVIGFYVVAVVGGYSWLRFVRKNEQVALTDVALFRVGAVRRSIAVQHFAKAQVEWDAKNYQAAFLFFSVGVRQDPDNVPGRLTAVRFLRSVGAGSQALLMLEEGLARAPDDLRLIEPTFEFLLKGGRERRALDLLRQRYGTDFVGPNRGLLQRYEVEATLAVEGAVAAKRLIEKNPDLLKDAFAAKLVARILWDSQERLKAVGIMQQYVKTSAVVLADYALLAEWQQASGLPAEAVATARRACAQLPREVSPRVLLIETVVNEAPAGPAGPREIAAYLREFGSRPEGLSELAILAGKKGWVDLCRSLYEVAATRERDPSLLALAYSDALARVSRFREARQVLTELESQVPDGNAAFMVQLRQRQVIASAALSDSDNVREYARRLAALLSREPDGLDACRRIFQRLGILEAVAELSSRSLAAAASAKK